MKTMLACRTDFSVGESILEVADLVEEAKRAGQTVVAMTDTMAITGMVDLTTKCDKAGIKPIIGVRLRMTDNATWRPGPGEKKKHMPRVYYPTVYALTEAGMKAIFRLLTLGHDPARFYYEAKLDWNDLGRELGKIDRHDLALSLGDERGMLEHPNLDALIEDFKPLVAHFYTPVFPVDTPYFGALNARSLKVHEDHGLTPLLTRPALYKPAQADYQEVMRAISENHEVTSSFFRSRFNRDLHALTEAEMNAEIVKAAKHCRTRTSTAVGALFLKAIAGSDELADLVSYKWTKQPVSLPVMAPDEFAEVKRQCQLGWKERFDKPIFGHKPDTAELRDVYLPRLKYELSVLERLKFSGYFLLVQDIVQYAKKTGILVGPGRGSVGGSLVAYLMGITDCDPIRFGLLFERFINPDRIDLPDADLDFMSERRGEIIDYLIDRYGKKRVAGVANFTTLASASAIRDVGRVMGIPERDYNVSKFVPKLHGQPLSLADSRKTVPEIDGFASAYEPHWNIMQALEGKIRSFSQHAAGVVVGGIDLEDRAVVDRHGDSATVCWDKRVVEEQGLVKVDVLGLSTLDVMKLTLDYIRERHGKAPDINQIPLDDPKVLEKFALGKTTGVFQFESGGMRRLLKELGADGTITFDDITAATALYRPGPMESGMMDSFYLRKQGNEDVEYDHPLMEPVLRETYGVMVYQEQVMRVSQVIAGYSGAEADKLRKIMGKKLPEEMKKERGKFVEGAVKTIGCTEDWAGELFDKIEGFAGYGFNKSHSVEYTLISYQSMWLKTMFPVEFFAAALSLMKEEKLAGLLRDAREHGVTLEVPDINHSTNRFEIISDTRLTMPFKAIKGLGDKTVEAILAARAAGRFTSKADFLARVEKRRCNIKHRELLDKVGAFAWIEPGQPQPDHPTRIKDQIDLLPGLIASAVPIAHDLNRDKVTKEHLAALYDENREQLLAAGEGSPTKPHFGRKASIMIITDGPSNDEDSNGMFGLTRGGSSVVTALNAAGMDLTDVYWTGLIKRPKRDKQVSAEEIALFKGWLNEEIEALKPPVIILLGSATVRHFIPTFKGKASEAAGKVIYFKDLDANVIVGFTPGEIYHDPSKQTLLDEIFVQAANMVNA